MKAPARPRSFRLALSEAEFKILHTLADGAGHPLAFYVRTLIVRAAKAKGIAWPDPMRHAPGTPKAGE